jgi:chromate transporter
VATRPEVVPGTMADRVAVPYKLAQLSRYALGLGTWGFGGPVALVGYMHRDLVERRKWISEADYKEGLTLAQIMPGPLAAQLAIYVGYVHYGVRGATVVGLAFVLPSFLMVVALGWAYQTYGGLPWMQAAFYGIGASVIGIITLSACKLARKTLAGDWLLWLIFLISASVTVVLQQELVLLFLGAGALVWFVRAPPALLRRPTTSASAIVLPLAALSTTTASVDGQRLWQIAIFFTKAGTFVFGSGLAIVPFLYGGVVKEYGWLNDQQFVDAVAVAMITPGPVVITVGFIGYLVAGFLGAVVAALATFLPCYLFPIIPAPYFKRHGRRPAIIAFVNGVTAAAVGAIAGAVIVLGRRTLLVEGFQPEWIKIGVCVATLTLLWRFKKLPEPTVVIAAGVLGLVFFQFAHP